jgi:hypothetical protein
MARRDDIVAIALLTRENVAMLRQSLRLVFRADDEHGFEELLRALDAADAKAAADHS